MLSVITIHIKHLSLCTANADAHSYIMLALAVVSKINEKSSLRITVRLSCINVTINVRDLRIAIPYIVRGCLPLLIRYHLLRPLDTRTTIECPKHFD